MSKTVKVWDVVVELEVDESYYTAEVEAETEEEAMRLGEEKAVAEIANVRAIEGFTTANLIDEYEVDDAE